MATRLIQRIARQAYRTFAGLTGESVGQQNELKILKELLGQVTCNTVNFNEQWLKPGGGGGVDGVPDDSRAPVTYVHLWEDAFFSMGLFILRRGVTLPLHDHPGMHGLIKVIHGTALIESYSASGVRADAASIPAEVLDFLVGMDIDPTLHTMEVVRRLQDTTVGISDPPCSLSPDEGNFHEIKSVDGPMAFLDILAPPYDHNTLKRVCHYYNELPITQDSLRFLIQVPQPSYFWCNQADYTGPTLNSETVTGKQSAEDDAEQR